MKMIKRVIALILVSVMALSFAGCHEKNEIAVKAGKTEFTSAYYMCALLNADSTARSKVIEKLSDKEKQNPNIDFTKKKIDGKDYSEWVKDEAVKTLKKNAAYINLCKDNKIEPKKEELNASKQYAEMYWANYGYAQLFEPNGVSKDTFVKYMSDGGFSTLYFDHLYAKDGTKAISTEEVNKAMLENFVLVDSVYAGFTDQQGQPMKEDQIKAIKEKFKGFETALKDGSKTFEAVYHEANGTSEADDAKQDAENKDKDAVKPVNRHANVLGAKKTPFESDDFDTVKAMAVNEVKLIEKEKNGGIIIYVKRDIAADPYFVDQVDSSVRHLLKDDEFNKEIDEYIKNMKFELIESAVKQFKVKKIKYPEQ